MSKHYYKTHIPNGETHTLCGLSYVQHGKTGIGLLPTVKHGNPGEASCKNCLDKFYGSSGAPVRSVPAQA